MAGAALVALLVGEALAGAGDVRSRFTTGAVVEASQSTGEVGAELLVGETLTAVLREDERARVTLRVAGRGGIDPVAGALRRLRVRDLTVAVRTGRVQLDVGRFSVDGGWRLADGAQARVDLGGGWAAGAWGGLAPDVVSTAPALRWGGGPVVGWSGTSGEWSLVGEALATVDGLDRLAAVTRGRVELGRVAELSGRADVQAVDRGVRLADAVAVARLDPSAALRVDLSWEAWSALAYLASDGRDPLVRRFASRSQALVGDPWIPQDALDPTVTHQVRAAVGWRRVLDGGTRLTAGASGVARAHRVVDRRLARADARVGLGGLAGGRVDLSLGQGVLRWPDRTAALTTASATVALDDAARVALDAQGELVLQPILGTKRWGPSVYADLFADVRVGERWSVSAGYAFSNAQDLERWDAWHALLVRATWRVDRRAEEGA